MELRRGYRETRLGGIGFPFIRFFSHLGKDNSAGVWSYMVFVFTLLMWTMVPFSVELSLIDMDSNLLIALLFLLIAVILNIAGLDRTKHGLVWGQGSKMLIYRLTLIVSFFICIASLILASRTFNLKEIVDLQRDYWNIVYQPLGFIISVLCTVLIMKAAGLNRDGRLGFQALNNSESGGFTQAVSKFSGYSIVLFMTYLITLLYLGGYKNLYFIRGDVMLGIKFYFVFIFILFIAKALGSNISDTRIFMRISSKFIIPLSILNFVVTLGYFIYKNVYGLI
jgi:NADH-quinone oxidoreductase subunit H